MRPSRGSSTGTPGGSATWSSGTIAAPCTGPRRSRTCNTGASCGASPRSTSSRRLRPPPTPEAAAGQPFTARPPRLAGRYNERGRLMKIKRIEHVGVVVKDVEASRRLWEDCFGIKLESEEANAVRKLALYPVGESMVELIAGVSPDSRHAKMVAEGKGGLNHICFEVEDIDAALAELKAKGIPLIDQVPRIGHAGCRIAFIDPAATENCLIELAELPAAAAHGHGS